jgi:UDP-N-acetylglucosamine--N-acetylmuramyl-(pentapeptide) pyrophosphoryl-undecaprenol N-acetylglucosamine transferase
MTKVIITGGHHNAALVVADALRAKGVAVVWIGHHYAARGDKQKSAEYLEVTSHNYPFYNLKAGRFSASIQELVRLPVGFFQALTILQKERPDAVLTFGGYLGAAVALAASLRAIPVYLHEQTQTAGLANKLIGKFAKKIYLTWSDSQKHFNAQKTKVVGLPLRESIINAKPARLFDTKRQTLLIMGGKQGSHVLNTFVFKHIEVLLEKFNIIHQTGSSSQTGDHTKAIALKEKLGERSKAYLPLNYIGEENIGAYLKTANLYLGRSGAHVTYELAVLGIKAILVPFIHTHEREQEQNAQYLKSVGLGEVINESSLTVAAVLQAAEEVIKQKAARQDLTKDAAALLVTDILKEVRAN